MFSKNKGFTLIELLIVIAILAVLASVTVIAINPADIFRRTRDSQRISDLDSIRTAINFYVVNTSSPNFGSSAYSYSHVANTNCAGRTPLSTTSQLVDGTGWIPVNLTSLGMSSPLSKWPIDPNPTTATSDPSYYYVYLTNSTNSTFEIIANMESDQYSNGGSNDVESKDGGKIPDLYEIGTEFILTNTDTNCYPYEVTPTFALNVQSMMETGVAITSSSGHGGITNYTINVTPGTTVVLTAPTKFLFLEFSSWSGCVPTTYATTISFSMPASSTTCEAFYYVD